MSSLPAQVLLAGDKVDVVFDLDTQAEVSVMPLAMFNQLKARGLLWRSVSGVTLNVVGGARVPVSVACRVRILFSHGLQKPVDCELDCVVVDHDFNLLIGKDAINKVGLASLVTAHASKRELPEARIQVEREPIMLSDPVDDAAFQQKIRDTLAVFTELFSGILPEEGADLEKFRIEIIEGMTPQSTNWRRVAPNVRDAVTEKVTSLIEQKVIREPAFLRGGGNFSSAVVMVKKNPNAKPGEKIKWRMCLDLKPLNKCTKPMVFPARDPREILESFDSRPIKGKIDLMDAFHLVQVEESSIQWLGFQNPLGMHEWIRMPEGLRNAAQFFQQQIEKVLGDLVGNGVEVFIDDIMIAGRDQADFLQLLEKTCKRLTDARLRARLSKCEFGMTTINFLGHVINQDGVWLSEERKQGITDIPYPTTAKKMRSFIGGCNYFRPHCPGNLARALRPLHAWTKKKGVFILDEAGRAAVDDAKKVVLAASMLYFARPDLPLTLRTDGSLTGVGALLVQEVDGKERLIYCLSRGLNETESRWHIMEIEAYAVYWAVMKLDHFLRCRHFVVETDHKNLLYLFSSNVAKVQRWARELQDYDFTVKHISGESNVVADMLSRCFAASLETVASSETEDEHTRQCLSVHNTTIGHHGRVRMVEMLRDLGVSWPGMKKFVAKFVDSCPVCQVCRLGRGSVAAAVKTTHARQPFDILSVDLSGPYQPADKHGYSYIAVIRCCFSGYVQLYPMKEPTAKEAAAALLKTFGMFGAPRKLRSDQGSHFVNSLIEEFLKLLHVEQQLTLPYHPEANGLVERAVQEVNRHLRAIMLDKDVQLGRDNWSTYLPLVQRIMNSTVYSPTASTPQRLIFGDVLNLNRSLLFAVKKAEDTSVEGFIRELGTVQREALRRSAAHLQSVDERRLRGSPEAPTDFAEGSYVLLSWPHDKRPAKLMPSYDGPYTVLSMQGNVLEVQSLVTLKVFKVPVARAKPYDPSRTPDVAYLATRQSKNYVVEELIDHRFETLSTGKLSTALSKLSFLVRWQGFSPEDDTWEPYQTMKDQKALTDYLAKRGNEHLKERLNQDARPAEERSASGSITTSTTLPTPATTTSVSRKGRRRVQKPVHDA